MNIDELNSKLDAIKDAFEKDKSLLLREYALSNNIIKTGDIVTDHACTVIVDKIKYTESVPSECVYFGAELTKKLVPKKNGSRGRVFQSNVLTVNGREYDKK